MTQPLTDPELVSVQAEFRKQRTSFIVTLFVFMFFAFIAPFYPSKSGAHPFLDLAPLPVLWAGAAAIMSIFLIIIYVRKVARIKTDLRTKEKLIVEGELLKKRKSYTEKEEYLFFVNTSESPKPSKITVKVADFASFNAKEKLHVEMTPKARFILKISKIKKK